MSSLGCIKFSTGSKIVLIINYLENKPKSKIHQGYKITMYSPDDNYKGGVNKRGRGRIEKNLLTIFQNILGRG